MSTWEETKKKDQGNIGEIISLGWPGNTLGSQTKAVEDEIRQGLLSQWWRKEA